MVDPLIVVIGVQGCDLSNSARIINRIPDLNLLVAREDRLRAVAHAGLAQHVEHLSFEDGLELVIDRLARTRGAACVLASGDPGFFGITRALAARVGPSHLEIHPAPSAVSLAFARLGLAWDDARVVSAHGRPVEDAVREIGRAAKVAVLCSPDAPPEAIGQALLARRTRFESVVVCSDLGCSDELVSSVSLEELATREWRPTAVVVLLNGTGVAENKSISWNTALHDSATTRVLTWGMPESSYSHRRDVITKAEVRAVVISKLSLPTKGVLWDIGAGSGSVGIECSIVCPDLEVFAVESRAEDASRIAQNARSKNSSVHVVNALAPEVLGSLPDPDRVFVGGGGPAVIKAALARLCEGGRIVATFASMDRALSAADLLGSMTQVSVARARKLEGGSWRLAAENPVFVTWGPHGGAR